MRIIRKKRQSAPKIAAKRKESGQFEGELELPAQWKQWLATNRAKLFNYARQQTRSQEDAEDVLQDSIARMWKHRDRCPDGVPAVVV